MSAAELWYQRRALVHQIGSQQVVAIAMVKSWAQQAYQVT